jgi:hypothetical protein
LILQPATRLATQAAIGPRPRRRSESPVEVIVAGRCRDSGKALRPDGASRVRQLVAEPAKNRIRCRSGRYCGREPAGSASPTACRPARSHTRSAVDNATRRDHRCPRDACAAGATVGASANPIAVNPAKVRRRHLVRPPQCPSRCRPRESVVPLAIGTDVLRCVGRRRFCAASGNGCFRLRPGHRRLQPHGWELGGELRRLRPVSAVRQDTIELRVRRHGSPRLACCIGLCRRDASSSSTSRRYGCQVAGCA